ncbi:thiamine phosphate synthase [Inquilinus limosus]|uniref:thiamine phosphate synthase n=1 Tax=Inquilinus limosus TaxID=171674 RepID=UPI0003FB8688|nr:thiamine phosphate synthase [Inquilinus limosus]
MGAAVEATRPGRRFDLSVYLVTDTRLSGPRGVAEVAAAAARGGVTLVQLRDPDATTRALIAAAGALQAVLAPHGIPLIVNDRVDVALAAGADGVHLGDRDMPAATARRLLGPDRIVGVTVHDAAEARAVDPAVADYAGIGPVFATTTKAGARPAIGVDGFRALRRLVPLPAVGIGGIDAGRAADVIAAGANGVAVVSAICAAPDPEEAARSIAAAVAEGRTR